MIRMINKITGGDMWVHPLRLDEYLEAGHKLASAPEKPATAEPVKRPPSRRQTAKK